MNGLQREPPAVPLSILGKSERVGAEVWSVSTIDILMTLHLLIIYTNFSRPSQAQLITNKLVPTMCFKSIFPNQLHLAAAKGNFTFNTIPGRHFELESPSFLYEIAYNSITLGVVRSLPYICILNWPGRIYIPLRSQQ